MSATTYNWNVTCQVCRETIKGSEALRRWDGLIVGANHPGCMEHRHPLDMPRPLAPEQRTLPFTSPEGTDTFIETCTLAGRSGVAGYAVAGCAIAGMDISPNDIALPTGTFTTNNETL